MCGTNDTTLVGVVPVSQYHCMAIQAAEVLSRIAKGELPAKDFPKGVLHDIKAFLGSATEEAKYQLYGRFPSNPSASMRNRRYAVDALHASGINCFNYVGNIDAILLLVSLIFCDLSEPHVLTGAEMIMAGELARFFGALAKLRD